MKLKKMHWLGLGCGLLVAITAVLIFVLGNQRANLFFFILGIGIAIAAFPFVVQLTIENKREQETSERFLEFARNLAESVVTGTPISKSIINMSRKNYGVLSPHITKLANQIALGIPVNQALQTFSRDVDNPVIGRAIGLISEAERAGGEIDYILDSVSKSIAEVERLRSERRAAISSLVVQGYIIFFIFIGIMLVMEFKILPLAVNVSSFTNAGADITAATPAAPAFNKGDLSWLFLLLLLAQGFFTGLTVGKLAEGSIKAGFKHSFILMMSALLISTGLKAFFH